MTDSKPVDESSSLSWVANLMNNMKKIIKNLFTKIKQAFCEHNGSYSLLEYSDSPCSRKTVFRCDQCGFGKEKFAETEKFLLERNTA